MKKLIYSVVIVIMAGLTFEAKADTANITASKDSLIASGFGEMNAGAITNIIAGNSGAILGRLRSLIQFNLSGLPANATITNATLRLNYLGDAFLTNANVDLHRLIKTWNEGTNQTLDPAAVGDTTWTNQFFDPMTPTPWTTPGGDFTPAASATLLIGTNAGFITWNSAGLLSDVQLWKSNPGTNFGWIIITDETKISAKLFHARESVNPPTLIVDYTTNAVPSGSLAAKFDKLVPKDGKKLSFKVAKGFRAKGKLFTTDGSAATNAFTGDIYAFFKAGTNSTAPVKLTKKTKLPKGQVKKGLLAQFKADKTSGRVGIGAAPVSKDTAVEVVFFASNSAGTLYKTNSLTAKNIK